MLICMSLEEHMVQKEPGYRWSVVAVTLPQYGKALMEKWLTDPDRDIRWIMRKKFEKSVIGLDGC